VGITNKYSVVLFGDDISAPATEGSRANTIVGGAALGQRKTLFQDIFGASAFADLSHVPPHVDSNSVIPPSALPRSDNDVPVLLDSPAYLMPPIESLYEPIMESFLKPRSQEDDIHLVEGIEQDEDVEMAEQSDDEPVTVRGRQERLVDQKEMDLFVKLFQQTKVSSNQAVGPDIPDVAPSKVNGIHHPTSANSKVNGVQRHPSTSQPSAGIVAKSTPTPSSTPGAKKIRKRKRPSESS